MDGADGELAVEEVFFAYFMDNPMFATQTHLEPVYVFKCRLSYSVYDMEINDTLKLYVQASA
jgi:hypothetical protein